MNNLLKWIKDNPIRSMFLVPIFLVAGISISHVVAWYDINRYKEFIQTELMGFLKIFGFGYRYGQGASIYLETPKIINRR